MEKRRTYFGQVNWANHRFAALLIILNLLILTGDLKAKNYIETTKDITSQQSERQEASTQKPITQVSLLDHYPMIRNFVESPTMEETRFNQLIDSVVTLYQSKSFALKINDGKTTHSASDPKIYIIPIKHWDTPDANIINAEARQATKGIWEIHLYRGLATRIELSEKGPGLDGDGFVTVICHEIGHHFAGYPFTLNTLNYNWFSVEGNADYFATNFCLRNLWENDKLNNARAAMKLENLKDSKERVTIKNRCEANWKTLDNRQLCYRISLAGLATAQLWQFLDLQNGSDSPPISNQTPSEFIASWMDASHPPAQARLDTYVAGALCNKIIEKGYKDIMPGIIPQGIDSTLDELEVGHKSPMTIGQAEMAKVSCTFRDIQTRESPKDYVLKRLQSGARPRHWYHLEVNLVGP